MQHKRLSVFGLVIGFFGCFGVGSLSYQEVIILNNASTYKTKQREAILDFLIQNKNDHVTVNKISDYLEKEGTHVGLTTIYRHLDKLLEQGLVRKFIIDGTTSACFQYIDQINQCHKHFHLKCEKCGKLIHLNCSHVSKICMHILEEHGFKLDLFRTVFYGICEECGKEYEADGGKK